MHLQLHQSCKAAVRLGLVGLVTAFGFSLLYLVNASGKPRLKPASVPPGGPVTVGTSGNEPLVTIAPDGTLYISALQHLYRSDNGGASWIKVVGPIISEPGALATDSSIHVDPGNRLYFTFDYPYAGTTAVCTTDNKGLAWSCNPAVVPGGTDRMWVLAPSNNKAYEVSNQGLYETAFLTSTDRGLTWVPRAIASGLLEPQSGPLLQKPCSNKVLQPIKTFGTLPSDLPEVRIYVYDPETTGAILSDVRGTGLPLPTALPSGALSGDGVLYVASEEANPAGGRQIVVARSADEAVTWKKLPPIPATITGTATFSWVAAGAPGHIGVLYYYSNDHGDPGLMTTANWSARWAESYNGDTANPTWAVTTVEELIHTGAICIAAGCSGTNRFAGDFISSIIDSTGAAHLTWMKRENGIDAISVRYQRIQSGPPSPYVPGPCGPLPLPVVLNAVVSRKMHQTNPTPAAFDLDLPLTGPHGIECRDGGPNGQHQMVFTFAEPLTSVQSADVSSGTGEVQSSAINSSDAHQYIVNLTGVADRQPIFVTLHGVQDSAGHSSDTIAAAMDVLAGDTNGDRRVNVSDSSQAKSLAGEGTTQTTARVDVTLDGRINTADTTYVKARAGGAVP